MCFARLTVPALTNPGAYELVVGREERSDCLDRFRVTEQRCVSLARHRQRAQIRMPLNHCLDGFRGEQIGIRSAYYERRKLPQRNKLRPKVGYGLA